MTNLTPQPTAKCKNCGTVFHKVIGSMECPECEGQLEFIQEQPTAEEKLVAKIISFKENFDCIAITDKGEKITVDPFVGCSWKYENKEALIGEWFEDTGAFKNKDGVWLTSEEGFKLLSKKMDDSYLEEAYLKEIKQLHKDLEIEKGRVQSLIKQRNKLREDLQAIK